MLYISSPTLTYFVAGSLYRLIFLTYFTWPPISSLQKSITPKSINTFKSIYAYKSIKKSVLFIFIPSQYF